MTKLGAPQRARVTPARRRAKVIPAQGINDPLAESRTIMIRTTTEALLRAPGRFEQLALPHLDAAYSLALWLMRDRADAEDVEQDAYIRALRAYDGFRGETMRPWLLAIVRNVAWRAL